MGYINVQLPPRVKNSVSMTKPNRLILFREIIAVYCENQTEPTNTLCGQCTELHFMSVKAAGSWGYHSVSNS
jgi:hypothetical protein